MHSKAILQKFNCTSERLREIFTSLGPGESNAKTGSSGASSPEEALTTGGTRNVPYQGTRDSTGETVVGPAKKEFWEIRRRYELRIRDRVLAGIGVGINNAKPLQAVDMAWDAAPIQKETIPLMLWAQGKIKQQNLCGWLRSNCDSSTVAKFVTKDSQGNEIVNLPRICDIAINLPRSYVTRRHAAISALWDNLHPLLRYDSRGTSQKDVLSADAVTQVVDVMSDEYNYRHFLSQTDRDKLKYAQSLIFPRAAWDCKKGWRLKKSNVPGSKSTDEVESYIVREGLDCVNPHPSRWFYDLGASLANVNTDNGPTFIGYWDIVPYQTIREGPYYNIDRVVASEAWAQLVGQYEYYFAQYFDPCVLAWPPIAPNTNPALYNDRLANVGVYSGLYDDKGVLRTEYFEKINPKAEGICDYDAEIWMRLSAAGDGTVIAGEFLPSIPACYGGINCDDNRVANASLGSEMLAFQDQVSNILTTMNEQVRRSFTQLWVFNKDLLDEKIIKMLEENAANREWWIDPKVLMLSFSEKQELLSAGKFDPSMIMFQVQTQLNNAVGEALRAIGQLLALADRIVNSSPNELGQPMPREVSAKETQTIETSIQSIYSFYNQGPREQRAAFKKMIWESLRCFGSDRFAVPVLGRYSAKTVKAAGFTVAEPPEGMSEEMVLPGRTHILGSLSEVDFDVQYTTRDGMERPVNTQGAQVLQQLFGAMMQIPGLPEKLGARRVFEIINIISRMAGAPDEFQVLLDQGEDASLGPGEDIPPALQKVVQDLMTQMQALAVKDAATQQALQAVMQQVGLPPMAPPQQSSRGAPRPGTGSPPPAAPGASSAASAVPAPEEGDSAPTDRSQLLIEPEV
jgi:hypothetical protein